MFRRRSGIPSNIRGIERFVWGLYSAPITASSFRFWGSATSGRLGRVTVLPQLKVDRLCSVVDGTAEFDPKLTRAVGSANPDQTRSRRGEPDELSDGELQRRVYCTGELKEPRNSINDFIPERRCRE